MQRSIVGVVAALVVAAPAGARAGADAKALMPVTVTASSTKAGKGKDKDRYAAWRALDSDTATSDDFDNPFQTTAWCEGKSDEGVGEYLELSADDLSFSELDIAAGFQKSDKLFQANNRPTKLTVEVIGHDGKTRSFDVNVPADRTRTTLAPGGTIDAKDIKITFAAVARGKVNDTCISDITVKTGDDARSLDTRNLVLIPAAAVTSLAPAVDSVAKAIAACDTTSLDPMLRYPITYQSLPDDCASTMSGEHSKKSKWKSSKAFAKSCKRHDVPSFNAWDASWVESDGLDKVRYRYGGNDCANGWAHLAYDEATASWQVTGFDFTAGSE